MSVENFQRKLLKNSGKIPKSLEIEHGHVPKIEKTRQNINRDYFQAS